jgi:beta-mannosidase
MKNKMEIVSLNGKWDLWGCSEENSSQRTEKIEATVPGCVQLDLSRAGILPNDLFFGMNILETEKYEGYSWYYEKRFTVSEPMKNAYLVFEGADCVCEYYLNGKKIGESDNMFISHEFCVDGFLKAGENLLTVHIKSALISECKSETPVRSLFGTHDVLEDIFIRKAPHSFGWDIMPRAVTAGLWRDVRLEARDEIYFKQLYVHAKDSTATVVYELATDMLMVRDVEIELEGSCGEDSSFYVRRKQSTSRLGRICVDISNPKLWFPREYGEANVYDAKARIYKGGILIHEEKFSFGIREVVLDRTDTTDGINGRFRFLINGVEIMCKGSNWVPLDAFHSRDKERYERALELVYDIGCNILRCWGGNVYEDHEFFDFCDRNGIMIWQDFSMACHVYPETEAFKRKIKEEATAVVKKLRNHPSIILWAGDNEIDQMMFNLGILPSKNAISRRWLPDVVNGHDPFRPYLASSPYICDEVFEAGDRDLLPEDHSWGPRDYFKSSFYADKPAHFISETGYHGCPNLTSIKKFISEDKVWPYTDNEEWILHSTDQKGDPTRVMLMDKQVRQLFGEVPSEPEQYIIASQISQAEAKKFFIERIRADRPRKTGIIWWNLLDGWPQMSDAVVDYYFEKKLAYHYIKRCQAPFIVCGGEMESWELKLYGANDTLLPMSGSLTVKDAETDKVLLETEFSVPANTSRCIARVPVYYSEQKVLIFEWVANGVRGINHFLTGFPPYSLDKYVNLIKKYGLDK